MITELRRRLGESGAFICQPSGAPSRERKTFPVVNVFMKPAKARKQMKPSPDGPGLDRWRSLLRAHDGFVLFASPRWRAKPWHADEGLKFCPAADFAETIEELRESFDWLPPRLLDEFVPIGGVASAPVFICVRARGRRAGAVYVIASDPVDDPEKPIAPNVDEFLRSIGNDPARVLNDVLGCHTRYTTRGSKTQWVPLCYERGAKSTPRR
jgi:hypothetical protein